MLTSIFQSSYSTDHSYALHSKNRFISSWYFRLGFLYHQGFSPWCVAAALAPMKAKELQILPYTSLFSFSGAGSGRCCSAAFPHTISVNFSKSQLTPTQSIKYIGVVLDSQLMIAFPTEHRLDAILHLIRCFGNQTKLPFRSFLRLMGMLAATATVIPLGLHSLRPFKRCVTDCT